MAAKLNISTKWKVGAGAIALGAATWTVVRLRERAKLVQLLEASDIVQMAVSGQYVTWTVQEKAAELVGLTNTMSADAAYLKAIEEAQLALPAGASPSVSLASDVARGVKSLYEMTPDVPGVDTSSVFDAWYNYFTKPSVPTLSAQPSGGDR